MTPENDHLDDDPLIALADRAMEGRLTRDDARELEELLDGGFGAVQRYVQYVGLQAALHAEASAAADEEELLDRIQTVEHRRRSITAWKIAAALTACAFLMSFTAYKFVTWPWVVASVVETSSQFEWTRGEQPVDGKVRIGDQLHMTSGFADLRFLNGAQLSVRGPALLDVVSAKEVRLEYGQVLSHIPGDAVGFTVATPDGRLVDLGTEFLVSRNTGVRTATTVRQGLIEIRADEAAGAAPAKRLATNEAAVFDPGKKRWIDAPPDWDTLSVFDLKALGFEVVSGNVMFVPTFRGLLPEKNLSGKPGFHLIPERQSYRLTGTIRMHDRDGKEVTLKPGTVVSSFLLDGVGLRNGNWSTTTSISSKSPISGVIYETGELWIANDQVGLPDIKYDPTQWAGLEMNKGPGSDSISFSPDGRQIDVSVNGAEIERDQLRLIFVIDPVKEEETK